MKRHRVLCGHVHCTTVVSRVPVDFHAIVARITHELAHPHVGVEDQPDRSGHVHVLEAVAEDTGLS